MIERHFPKSLLLLVGVAFLGGCEVSFNDKDDKAEAANAAVPDVARGDEVQNLRFEDVALPTGQQEPPRPIMQAQVVLDRLGYSSGVIDGKEGANFALALREFQEARGLAASGKLDDATRAAFGELKETPATRLVRIPEGFARGPFTPDFPEKAEDQAKLPHLGYRNLMEALAERFHTTPETLVALNSPGTKIGPNAVIRVPNVAEVDGAGFGKDERGWNRTLMTLAVSPEQKVAARVVVDKSDGVLRAYDAEDKVIAQFPATMGSEHDPLPIGRWKIQGVSRNPDFHYNPKLFWDVSDNEEAVLLKPGPNGPVGVVWIDLSKPHYGIHGTDEPQTIGRAQSHGCVRLTNWDAARLAQMVRPGIAAIFQE